MSTSSHEEVYGSLPALPRRHWLRVPEAVRHSGLSRTELYRKISTHEVESFVYKSHPGAISGIRLIRAESLDALLDRMALAAKQEAKA
jgi:hypothetical protein